MHSVRETVNKLKVVGNAIGLPTTTTNGENAGPTIHTRYPDHHGDLGQGKEDRAELLQLRSCRPTSAESCHQPHPKPHTAHTDNGIRSDALHGSIAVAVDASPPPNLHLAGDGSVLATSVSPKSPSRTVAVVLVLLFVVAFGVVMHKSSATVVSSISSFAGGKRRAESLLKSRKANAAAPRTSTPNPTASQRPKRTAPSSYLPPVASQRVWSRGSWMRFNVDSDIPYTATRTSALSSKIGLVCEPHPSVDSLAVQCDFSADPAAADPPKVTEQRSGKNGNGVGSFPLTFLLDVVDGLTTHAVKCVSGCSAAHVSIHMTSPTPSPTTSSASIQKNSVQLGKEGRQLAVTVQREEDLSGSCASLLAGGNSRCILSFDFLVSYDLNSESNSTTTNDLNTGPNAFPPVCFLSLGDWGFHTVASTAATMPLYAKTSFAKFIVSTGDNFYIRGVHSLSDPLWGERFEEPFSSPFLKNIRWYVIAGNHDHLGNVTAQLEYGNMHPRWYFPSLYYADEMPLFSVEATPVADTTTTTTSTRNSKADAIEKSSTNAETQKTFFPSRNPTLHPSPTLVPPTAMTSETKGEKGGTRQRQSESASILFTFLDYNGPDRPAQQTFLRDTLTTLSNNSSQERKKKTWRALVNHPPLFGGTLHAQSRETKSYRQELKPIIDTHSVHFYLGGHDHVLEVLRSGTTDYFISGAGGPPHRYVSKKIPETVWWQGKDVKLKGFMRHCVHGHDRMETTLIDDSGKELYTHVTPFDN